ncbi:single-stranded-DNA-specific exonuclease RecJ [Tissierella creatinophila]|uniref:Single-stranded-DNA-specific exonuclease RecJ n=1 Tax=Tissierella creatinophila DSM 6911 TaxID=1123403 RepID=A0A1U7M2X6_TISCR|nr:single-stranded-DNA-specific exonuclease RecJ [Tissierella creatinophila]OLS01673.1 single-stranded-DNA-specific exonuclease RecJ [Tissierella creatinophila DSM 6911]
MEKWFVRNKNIDYNEIAKKNGISQIVSKILVNREIFLKDSIENFLNGDLNHLHSPIIMNDIEKAGKLIKMYISQNKRIRIVGDYDVDGVMSTYILYTSFLKLGANIDYVVPDRIKDGYGINESIVKTAKEENIDLIITCDNGISAFDAVNLSKQLGIKMIITDHHDLSYKIQNNEKIYMVPDADAVINPKNLKCEYPFKKLCGAGVAYKLIEYVYDLYEINKNELYSLLEYVGIATVCDVVDLIDENRIIVKHGLNLINNTKNIGLKALIEVSGIKNKISTYHLGFIIGPTINASGRLETALLALDLLLCKDEITAYEIAENLRALNEERKAITNIGIEGVKQQIEETKLKKDKVLLVFVPDIHESVAGIVAGRIKEMYNKPTIVLTKSVDGVKGSGRSIDVYNLFEELNECKELLKGFGGHPMAAGLSLHRDNIENLRTKLNNITSLKEEDFYKKIYIDLVLPISFLNDSVMEDLNLLEPFGKGNSKPLFGEKNLSIKKLYKYGEKKNVLKFNLYDNKSTYIDALIFNNTLNFEESIISKYGNEELEKLYRGEENNISLDIIYYPSYNHYNGKTTIQITIESYRI